MLTKRALLRAACLAGVAGLAAVPAQAVNIPEGGAVTPDSVFVIHFQVREGCDGAPMDALEVAVPASVQNPTPEAVDGWDVAVTPAEPGSGDSTILTWSGGPLEEGSFKEFGLWARFPDEPGAVLTFPAVQRCGTTEVIWDGSDGATPAPTVALTERIFQEDLEELRVSVGDMASQVDEINEQLGDVDAANLRSRVSEAEEALEEIVSQVEELTSRIGELEPPTAQE
jgi:uncharacterized protein YcnI